MAEIIKRDNRLPLYYQLYDIIINKIESGIYKEHDKLPSERELCDKYNISRATVRKAMDELEKKDYIYKEHGRGIFVSPKAFKQDLLNFYSFTEEMKKIGRKPSSEVINFEKINVDEELIKKLNCKKGIEFYKVTRLRLADEEPMMFETSFLPVERFKGLTKKDLENNAMYDIFRNKYNVIFKKAEENFQATAIRENESLYLDVKKGSPGIFLERYTYENDNIIEYTSSIARGDKFKFHVVLE